MDKVTSLTQKGQVTVPIEYRRKLGLKAGQKVRFEYRSEVGLLLKPVQGILSLMGALPSKKKFNKTKARRVYLPQVLAGKI